MINIAICDDEKYISDKVKKLALDFFHRKNVEIKISQFGSGEELLRYNKSIDILFLDIQMDGIDGMETARKLRSQNYKGYLIFITVLKGMVSFRLFLCMNSNTSAYREDRKSPVRSRRMVLIPPM